MAVKSKEAAPKEGAKPAAKETPAPRGPGGLDKLAPYIGPGFVVSLALVFVGERMLGTIDNARIALSGLGVAGALATTALRFSLVAGQTDVQRQRIERALGATGRASAAAGLFDLAHTNGAPVALKDIGMNEADLDRAAEIAVSNPYWNPRPFGAAQRGEIRDLLQRAYEGIRPD